jgi:hypothetical protein
MQESSALKELSRSDQRRFVELLAEFRCFHRVGKCCFPVTGLKMLERGRQQEVSALDAVVLFTFE